MLVYALNRRNRIVATSKTTHRQFVGVPTTMQFVAYDGKSQSAICRLARRSSGCFSWPLSPCETKLAKTSTKLVRSLSESS